ncbi:hypothetical protein XI06_13185 [Bradyrhizobium sp. CCBAU 11434]|uniref:hypothetical protein n=1 Tax=Bradyrhizobium sp. CCBAU 11434 TaxID=1630885 RepID=UPI00230581C3|nr:hypothetical protein [Bradyrhizobium sp. CCBAU 11434]MDA9521299.1 hypothetical protein [Bradyrhizobium sp. CCBAU 11434]
MDDQSRLPPKAHLKILALEDSEQAALTLASSTTRRISELRSALGLNPNSPNADAMRLEVERLELLQRKHQDQHRQRADLNNRVRRYLSTLPARAHLADARPARIKLKDGETFLAAIERIRTQIAHLASDRLNVEQSGLPVSEMKAQAKKWITESAIRGRPTIKASHDRFEVIFVDPAAYSMHLDVPSLLAWFDPQGMELKLNELIDAMPAPKLALTPSEKIERLRKIADDVLDQERLEEAIIVLAEETGQHVPRRPNCDPRALLGLVVDRAKADAA